MKTATVWIVWQFGKQIGTVCGSTQQEAMKSAKRIFGGSVINSLSVTLGRGQSAGEKE